MPISVICSGCQSKFKAPDKAAGRRLKCPKCATAIEVPKPEPTADDDILSALGLADAPSSPAGKPSKASPANRAGNSTNAPDVQQIPVPSSTAASEPSQRESAPSPAPQKKQAGIAPVDPSRQTGLLRHLHWWLALAMLPLAISIFMPNETTEDLERRVVESILSVEETSVEQPTSVAEADAEPSYDEQYGEDYDDGDDDPNTFFQRLPGHKLKGAFLARDSYMHWLFAFASAACFMTLLVLLATDNSANPLHLLGLGAFTATGGILLLLGLQSLAMSGLGRMRIRGGIGALFVLLLLLIGASYRMALDPDIGVIPSFLGFTAGVGFCEEFVKALPLIIYFRGQSKLTWRGAFLWGLASGTGFGIAEGIMYSGDMYNGISGPLIYFVRFISCVALHAIWTGSVGISIQQRQDLLQEDASEDWWMFLIVSVRLVAIPMILHGLYDTLLKKDMEVLALVTAFASFGYLAWLFGRLRSDDETASRGKFVADFLRNRQAGTA